MRLKPPGTPRITVTKVTSFAAPHRNILPPMRLTITTDGVPERDRFDAWCGAVFSTLAISVERLPGAGRSFAARFSARQKGPLLNCSFDSDGFRAIRQSREIAHRQWHGYRIYRESSPGVRFSIGGSDIASSEGDLLIADADATFEAVPVARYADESWLLPKAMIEPHLPASRRRGVTRISGRTGTEALAAGYLEALTRNWDDIPEIRMQPVTDTLCRLIGIACGSVAEDHPDAVRAGRLAQAHRYIDQHLTDPELSPARVAAALSIAVRTLHMLFEPTGSSFGRHVLRRRLEECRTALLVHPSRPVTDIAFAWGFNSLSHFYHAFHEAYGMAPGELRREP
jgi:AraC-like DNA-binding protein